MTINLDDFIPGSLHFRWREALWLPKWGVYVFPAPAQAQNIIKVALIMDLIRKEFDKPIQILSWLRPARYNEWKAPYGVNGALASTHVDGKAVDFKIYTFSNEEVRAYLEPRLGDFNIRMEKDDGRDRIHIDIKTVMPNQNRYFKP